MKTRTSLATILITMLLTQSLHGLNWQAMGSGMNNTVISEIWNGIGSNLGTALNAGSVGTNNFVNDISDRLNAQWSQAWNVVLITGSAPYDSILYGYAFRNQWMWYNGVPYPNAISYVALIVWKDYNCQSWKNIGSGVVETSTFSSARKTAIRAEIDKMTEAGITNDVWGTAFTMMKNLDQLSLFSSGGFSVVMSQDGYSYFYGRVCRISNYFYYSYQELGGNPISGSKGNLYLFQTR